MYIAGGVLVLILLVILLVPASRWTTGAQRRGEPAALEPQMMSLWTTIRVAHAAQRVLSWRSALSSVPSWRVLLLGIGAVGLALLLSRAPGM
jgi:hypothetical protein